MPFDENLVLFSGLTGIAANNYTTKAIAVGFNAYGRAVRDIRETGVKGLAAVMVFPNDPVTAYKINLVSCIEVSDRPEFNWEPIANFPDQYNFIRRVPAKTTTPPVEADVGKYLYGGTTNDDGKIMKFDPGLYVADGTGYVYIAMEAAGDVFDNTSEALTVKAEPAGAGSAGTFVGVVNGVAADAPPSIQHAPAAYVVRFATNKRYVRFNPTLCVGNFHGVMVLLSPYPFNVL